MGLDEYEELCIKIKNENEKYLEIFLADLEESGLSQKTIRSHMSNADFYLNDFLLYGDALSMKDGCTCVHAFLGDFFIRKCMWSTPGTIKSTAASLKKFYKCMLTHGEVEKDYYNIFCQKIKDNIEDWMDTCSQFNDPDQESPFSYF